MKENLHFTKTVQKHALASMEVLNVQIFVVCIYEILYIFGFNIRYFSQILELFVHIWSQFCSTV